MTPEAARPLVITFLHHPSDDVAARLVEAAAALAEGVGAERAGVFMRVPVRVRAEPIGLGGALRPIRPTASALDVVVLLKSQEIEVEPAPFSALLAQVRRDFMDPARLLFLSILLDDVAPPAGLSNLQGIRWFAWSGLGHRLIKRIQMRVAASLTTAR